MKLLAVDTSTVSCSVALLDETRLLCEMTYGAGKTHSRHLMSMIDCVFKRCDAAPGDIDGIAVTKGPGTFTGLRIGLSTVKGLAIAAGIPVVGVSSLAALAYPMRNTNRNVVTMIDARRGEVYHDRFDVKGLAIDPSLDSDPKVAAPEEVAEMLPEDALLIGSGAILYRALFLKKCPSVEFGEPMQHVIRAASVGLLSMSRFRRKSFDPVYALTPQYIRKSDAQIHHVG